jgi:glycosyltransferase involved in cell wall biosynthesis
VVSTRVGGNEQVVASPDLGELVEFWDADAFAAAIERALRRDWDRDAIIAYARANTWDRRIDVLEQEFRALVNERSAAEAKH